MARSLASAFSARRFAGSSMETDLASRLVIDIMVTDESLRQLEERTWQSSPIFCSLAMLMFLCLCLCKAAAERFNLFTFFNNRLNHQLPCALNNSQRDLSLTQHELSLTLMRSHQLSYAPINSHALSSTPMRSH